MMKYTLFGIALILVMSCKSYSTEDLNDFDNKISTYIKENQLDFEKQENGLYYSIVATSDSLPKIKYTDEVTFYYTGKFLDGEIFQIIPENEALTFQVKELIAGWQEGLMHLRGPGTIQLIIPPHLGYGTKKTEKIPPNSILLYDLTVTTVR